MWDLIVSVPDHCLSFYSSDSNCLPWSECICLGMPYLHMNSFTSRSATVTASIFFHCKSLSPPTEIVGND